MHDTKENILLTALELFARDGYKAVSVSQIAGMLGITKGALYKHYKNKRDIFDHIVARMEQRDAARAMEFDLPEGPLDVMQEKYRAVSVEQLIRYSKAQLWYWTEDDFAASFRKMLTLEQYRDEEMNALYQNYLVSGPLGYMTDLFSSLGYNQPEKRALAFYAPMFFLYSLYDGKINSHSFHMLAETHFEQAYRHLMGEII